MNAFVLLIATLGAGGGDDNTVQELVLRQQSSLGLLWAIEMDIDVYFSNGGGEQLSPPLHMWHYHWAHDAQRDRQHYRQLKGELKHKDDIIGIGDMLDDGQQRKVLLNWDYAAKKQSVPYGNGSVQAHLAKRSRTLPGPIFPAPMARILLQEVQSQNFDAVRSIPDFLRESPRVSVNPPDKTGLVEVIASHPDDVGGGICKGCVTHLFFDRLHGGLVCRIRTEAPANLGATAPTVWDSEITKWEESTKGLFVPMETHSWCLAPGFDNGKDKLLSDARMIVSNVKTNDAVLDEAFKMPFPENAVVQDVTDPTRPVYHLWGPGDKIVATSADIRSLPVPVGPPGSQKSRFVQWTAPIGFATILLVLVAAWIYKRKMSS